MKWWVVGVVGLSVAILALWVLFFFASPWLAHLAGLEQKIGDAGDWGDAFGGFNALITAVGFIAVIATFVIQFNALRDQQLDQRRQQFDVTFFELLRLMRELRDEITFSHSGDYLAQTQMKRPTEPFRGNQAVSAALAEARYWILKERSSPTPITQSRVADLYTQYIHKRAEKGLGPYFRVMYSILSRVKKATFLSEAEKEEYGNLLRAQMASHEVALAAINSLAPVAKDMKDLLAYFHFLKYLPPGNFRTFMQRLLPKEAFEARAES